MRSKKKFALIFGAVILVIGTVVFIVSRTETRHEYDSVRSLAEQYYGALIQKDYDTAFGLLYRPQDTMFTDEFMIQATQEENPISYKIKNIKELAKDVYEVYGLGESDNGQGELDVKNYVIFYNSKYYFVIHWSDVPEELYDFGKVIGF